jgi:four helix bundle protein
LDGKTEQLRNRTKEFAVRIIHLFRSLPPTTDAQVIGNQLLRCGTSLGANYRSACHARSRAEFISRIGVVTEEANCFLDLGILRKERLEPLLDEARELTAIFNASRQTAKRK